MIQTFVRTMWLSAILLIYLVA